MFKDLVKNVDQMHDYRGFRRVLEIETNYLD